MALLTPKFTKLMMFYNFVAISAPSAVARIDWALGRQTGALTADQASTLRSMRTWLTFLVPLVCAPSIVSWLQHKIYAPPTQKHLMMTEDKKPYSAARSARCEKTHDWCFLRTESRKFCGYGKAGGLWTQAGRGRY